MEIFTRTIRLKNGRILVAEHYGKKAFRFQVSEEENEKYLKEKQKQKEII